MSNVPVETPTTPATPETWIPGLPTDTFGQRLYVLRKDLGLSAEACAAAIGVHPNTWRKWEAGGKVTEKDAVVERIVANLHPDDGRRVTRDWLMWGSAMDRYTENPVENVQARLFEPSSASAVRRGHLQAL